MLWVSDYQCQLRTCIQQFSKYIDVFPFQACCHLCKWQQVPLGKELEKYLWCGFAMMLQGPSSRIQSPLHSMNESWKLSKRSFIYFRNNLQPSTLQFFFLWLQMINNTLLADHLPWSWEYCVWLKSFKTSVDYGPLSVPSTQLFIVVIWLPSLWSCGLYFFNAP